LQKDQGPGTPGERAGLPHTVKLPRLGQGGGMEKLLRDSGEFKSFPKTRQY